MLLCNPGRSFVIIAQNSVFKLFIYYNFQQGYILRQIPKPILLGYNLRQIPFARRFLFAHICRNSLFIICSLQNSSYCLLSTISGFFFSINALLQQPCVPFHFDKQASFTTSTPTCTNFCLQNHKNSLHSPEIFQPLLLVRP